MATVKITYDSEEVRHIIADHIKASTGYHAAAEEVAFYCAEETDNPHAEKEIDISVSATAR